MCDCRTCRDEILAEIRAELAQPAPAPGPACWACGATVNCPDCATHRKLIDDYAAQSPVTATAKVTRRTP